MKKRQNVETTMMTRIGTGIFGWSGAERRSNRYGAVHLGAENESVKMKDIIDRPRLLRFAGKRVRIECVVLETRESGHIGDLFLGIYPSTPEVGERVELGVGTLGLIDPDWDGLPSFVLRPDDGRADLWIDPCKLYRLHDQTVEMLMEELLLDERQARQGEASL